MTAAPGEVRLVAGWIIIRIGARSGGRRPQFMLPPPPPRIRYRPTDETPSPSPPEPVRANLARLVRSGDTHRRVAASGQDIYAISAPLAVEAVHRILGGQTRTSGVASAGEIFDAPDFLRALSAHISLDPRHESRAPQVA
jgi:hypothetical protein